MKWISVKNALPKNGVKVVTYSEKTKKHNFCECLKSYVLEYGNYDEVTHWCFLPRIEKTVYVENKNCNQACPYNTLKGCVVMDRNGVCPLSITELLGMSEQLVRTNDMLIRDNKKYEVVIADDNIFVICPIVYDEKEKSDIVKYDKAEIYANQDCINTLKDLRFEKWKS